MKRYLLDQREELNDAHLQTEWASKKLGITHPKSIVGFFGPIKTDKSLGDLSRVLFNQHTDIFHLIVTIPRTSSAEVLLIQRLLASTIEGAIPGTYRIGPDIRSNEETISISYVSHLKNTSIIYMGILLDFEESAPLLGLKRTESEPNDLAITILSTICEDMSLIEKTITLLDIETEKDAKRDR